MPRLICLLPSLLLASAASATPVNGDFETGDLTGWQTFATSFGTLGSGFPRVEQFDTDNDGVSTFAAALNVGRIRGPGSAEGGGIAQEVALRSGDLQLSVAIASRSGVPVDNGLSNGSGGLLELLFDGVTVDSYDFGEILHAHTEYARLEAALTVGAGNHALAIRATRPYTSSNDTPIQYIDDVVLTGSAVPEPSTFLLMAFGIVAISRRRRMTMVSLAGWRRARE